MESEEEALFADILNKKKGGEVKSEEGREGGRLLTESQKERFREGRDPFHREYTGNYF